jgi:hypothetical protein
VKDNPATPAANLSLRNRNRYIGLLAIVAMAVMVVLVMWQPWNAH